MDTYEMITQILIAKYDVEPAAIAPEARFADLGLDSLVLAELSVILSTRLGIRVDDEELAEAGSIGAAADKLSDLTAAAATTV